MSNHLLQKKLQYQNSIELKSIKVLLKHNELYTSCDLVDMDYCVFFLDSALVEHRCHSMLFSLLLVVLEIFPISNFSTNFNASITIRLFSRKRQAESLSVKRVFTTAGRQC